MKVGVRTGVSSGLVGMVKVRVNVRVQGCVIHYAFEGPHKGFFVHENSADYRLVMEILPSAGAS